MTCPHVWLWPSNWERYCPQCGTVESYESGALGAMSIPALSAGSKYGQTVLLVRIVAEPGIGPLATEQARTFVAGGRNASLVDSESDSKE